MRDLKLINIKYEERSPITGLPPTVTFMFSEPSDIAEGYYKNIHDDNYFHIFSEEKPSYKEVAMMVAGLLQHLEVRALAEEE